MNIMSVASRAAHRRYEWSRPAAVVVATVKPLTAHLVAGAARFGWLIAFSVGAAVSSFPVLAALGGDVLAGVVAWVAAMVGGTATWLLYLSPLPGGRQSMHQWVLGAAAEVSVWGGLAVAWSVLDWDRFGERALDHAIPAVVASRPIEVRGHIAWRDRDGDLWAPVPGQDDPDLLHVVETSGMKVTDCPASGILRSDLLRLMGPLRGTVVPSASPVLPSWMADWTGETIARLPKSSNAIDGEAGR